MEKYDDRLKGVLEQIDVQVEPTETRWKDIALADSHKKKFAKIYTFDGPIEIVPIFDTHIGLKSCNKKKLKETMRFTPFRETAILLSTIRSMYIKFGAWDKVQ